MLAIVALYACKKDEPIDTISVNGALSGEFSVSLTDKVHFSQGNLQFNKNANTWRFATNQWEVYGGFKDGVTDLHVWSHADDSTFSDWGQYAISNGGNQPDQWRTLTKDEWMYLFHGRANAEYLFGFGKVNGVKGLIILPDNGGSIGNFKSAAEKGFVWRYTDYRHYYSNTKSADIFSHNTFKGKKWHEMENAGAVFLPAAGNWLRSEQSGQDLGKYGDYWSATRDLSTGYATDVFCMDFYQQALSPMCSARWDYEFSVRLVQ